MRTRTRELAREKGGDGSIDPIPIPTLAVRIKSLGFVTVRGGGVLDPFGLETFRAKEFAKRIGI